MYLIILRAASLGMKSPGKTSLGSTSMENVYGPFVVSALNVTVPEE